MRQWEPGVPGCPGAHVPLRTRHPPGHGGGPALLAGSRGAWECLRPRLPRGVLLQHEVLHQVRRLFQKVSELGEGVRTDTGCMFCARCVHRTCYNIVNDAC